MATLYFNGAVNNQWATLGNWWTNSGFTVQATSLPTSADDVVISSDCYGIEVTVLSLTVSGCALWDATVTFLNGATFTNGSFYDGAGGLATLTGDATFNVTGNVAGGTIVGNAIFNDATGIFGTIYGNATFNDNSDCQGAVYGDVTFNDNSVLYDGPVDGEATFNDNSLNYNAVIYGGPATFNDSSSNGPYGSVGLPANEEWEQPEVLVDATFNDNSTNVGTVVGTATFRNSARNLSGLTGGTVTWDYETGINGSSILGVL